MLTIRVYTFTNKHAQLKERNNLPLLPPHFSDCTEVLSTPSNDVVSFEQCGIPFSLSEEEPQVVQHSLHRASADRRHVHVSVADDVVA